MVEGSEAGRPISKGSYVRVIDTADEWEGLIGMVEEFMNPDKTTSEKMTPVSVGVAVFFPRTREELKETPRLRGVNIFTSWCKMELSKFDGCHAFDLDKVEFVDPADL